MKHENIICFAFMDYEINKQREQQEMERLSNGNRILFIESPYTSHFFSRRRQSIESNKKNLYKEGLRQHPQNKNLYLYTPIPSWFPFDKIPFINWLYYKVFLFYLNRELRKNNFVKPILWITQPRTSTVIGKLNEKLIVADWCNTWEEHWAGIILKSNLWKPIRYINVVFKRHWIKKLLKESDIVFANAVKYYNYALHYNKNTYLKYSGADISTFKLPDIGDSSGVTKDINNIYKPMVGVVAARIQKDIIDIEAIKYLAQKHPEYEIIFIGKIEGDIDGLEEIRNIRFIGYKDHLELPYYLSKFAVNLIPYRVNTLTQSGIPTKLPEYLAIGKPVVSTWLEEIAMAEEFRELTYLASNKEEFEMAVVDAINSDSDILRQKRIELARKYDWNEIVREMEDIIDERI